MMATTASMDEDQRRVQIDNDRYDDFLSATRRRFDGLTKGARAVFTTDAAGLWDAYLDAAPVGSRQSRTCNACKRFVERFGGLVAISDDGTTTPLFWNADDAPPAYRNAARALARIVARAAVTGVFLSSEKEWGQGTTGAWTHTSVTPPSHLIFSHSLLNAGQAMAEKGQDYETLLRGLGEFNVDAVRKAHAYLTNGSLHRSEKHQGVAQWLLDLHERRDATKNERIRANVTWLAVASAPPGFCHVKSGMIGTLLEDIVAGLHFDTLARRFNEKMDPLKYMRPVAPPTAGNIAQGEKVIAAMGAAQSLERRFAKLADVQALWLPVAPKEAPKPGGVFGHLHGQTTAAPLANTAPAVTMTWEKFARVVLPTAERIEYLVPHTRDNFSALVTAKHADAPPVLQWDSIDRRNPVSWYVYHGGSSPSAWGLTPGSFHEVSAVSLQPNMWPGDGKHAHQGESVTFILRGARDSNYRTGAGLFPECLKSEFHAVRATIEAYWRTAVIDGRDEAEACGIRLQKGNQWPATFRVTSRGVRTDYRLDRWD